MRIIAWVNYDLEKNVFIYATNNPMTVSNRIGVEIYLQQKIALPLGFYLRPGSFSYIGAFKEIERDYFGGLLARQRARDDKINAAVSELLAEVAGIKRE